MASAEGTAGSRPEGIAGTSAGDTGAVAENPAQTSLPKAAPASLPDAEAKDRSGVVGPHFPAAEAAEGSSAAAETSLPPVGSAACSCCSSAERAAGAGA